MSTGQEPLWMQNPYWTTNTGQLGSVRVQGGEGGRRHTLNPPWESLPIWCEQTDIKPSFVILMRILSHFCPIGAQITSYISIYRRDKR